MSLLVERGVSLCDEFVFLFFSGKVNDFVVFDVYDATVHFAVGSFNESKLVDLGVYTQRRDEPNIGTFGCFNRTETSVMGVVNVAHLKAGTFT